MDFDYTVTTEKSFDETVKAIEQEVKNAGFKVLYIHNESDCFVSILPSSKPW